MSNIPDAIRAGLRLYSEKGKQTSKSYRISQLFWTDTNGFNGACKRKLRYEFSGVDPTDPIGFDSAFRIELGNQIHTMLGKAMTLYLTETKVDIDFQLERAIEYNLSGLLSRNLTGHLDAWWPGHVIEFKSTFGKGFYNIPKPDHIVQAVTYLLHDIYRGTVESAIDVLNGNWGSEVNELTAYLVYISREGGAIKEFELHPKVGGKVTVIDTEKREVTQFLWPHLAQELLALDGDTGLPDRCYEGKPNAGGTDLTTASHWRCRTCAFKSKCYELRGA